MNVGNRSKFMLKNLNGLCNYHLFMQDMFTECSSMPRTVSNCATTAEGE